MFPDKMSDLPWCSSVVQLKVNFDRSALLEPRPANVITPSCTGRQNTLTLLVSCGLVFDFVMMSSFPCFK